MTMKTNKAFTNEILGGFLMSDNTLNVEYFASEVMDVAESKEQYYNECFNTRRKTRNIAIEWLMAFINRGLKNSGYVGYYATNAQVMDFDKAHGFGLEKALDIIEARVKEIREE